MKQEPNLDPQLWHACAGPLVKIPPADSRVFYFAQGHIEHANVPPDFNAPRVPPLILCRVVAVKYLIDAETDQVNAKITLLPLRENDLEDQEDDNIVGPNLADVGGRAKKKQMSFAKSLTESDFGEGSRLSVPRIHAGWLSPKHQAIIAKDILGETWEFPYITAKDITTAKDILGETWEFTVTGWSTFISKKKLTVCDLVIFLRSDLGEIFVLIRRAEHRDLVVSSGPGGVNTAGMVRVEEVAEALRRSACGQAFEVVYYPGAFTQEFFVKEADVRAAMMIRWCSGMMIQIVSEWSDGESRPDEGTVSIVKVVDPVRWPDSPWRLLQVHKDRNTQKVKTNPWLVQPISDIPVSISVGGVSSIGLDEDDGSIVLTDTMGQQATQTMVEPWKKIDLEKSHMKQKMEDEGEELALAVPESLSDAKRSRAIEGSEGAGSGSSCLVVGVNPQENPLNSVAQTSHLKAVKEVTPETECMLVFSKKDANELRFIKSISKKLLEGEVSPLTYSLSVRTTIETLHRFSVGIVVLSRSSVTLSDICGVEGRFETAFQQYLKIYTTERVQRWKAAIAEISSIDGYEWTKETEGRVTEEVVREACLRLHLKNSKNMVKILALLKHSQPSEADMVGIWGMAGIGKTSIAKEVFGTLAPRYDLCYFLQDFYLTCRTRGLRQMREDFYSKIFGEEKLSIASSDIKPSFMRNWFQNKTILLVLDDVSNARDAEAVVGGFGWFSQGHRVILTSRRKQVLVQCKVKQLFEIQNLSDSESFRLCKQHLNGESGIISELMSCCSGIPLALNVFGSTVSKQHVNNMKDHLQILRRNPPNQIQEAFRRSFDGLDENEKSIFLDLACFFIGENKDYVVRLLDACGFRTYLGICDLIDESLISLLDNTIDIPIAFQDIGRFIVYEEDKEDPSERSRLWDSKDIADVLTNNSGTEAIEGIFLDASDLNCELSPTVFGKMYRLRLLKFYRSTSGNQCKLSLPQGLDTLPDDLRLLHWENYPLRYLPQKFNPENLVELNMPYSNLEKLWEGKKDLVKLKKINLNHSTSLTDILLLSEALNLEHIDLEGCTSLVDVSTSIPRCGKLVSLNMKDCSRLRSLPAMVSLTSLKLLNMSGCSEFEEIQDFAPNLKELYLSGTAIRELPISIENLAELDTLDLENCRRLEKLPSGIKNSQRIVKLKLSECTSPGTRGMECLVNSPSPFPSLIQKRKRNA
ncbi:Disease resistance protein RPP2A [Hirschfeldia incana]|nr:Disease resistance protein RPP2A [Hirschfeldia incana]